MNVVQSYLVTIMRGDFSLYEIRIFMKIVEVANAALEHKKISTSKGSCASFDGRSCIVNIPIRQLLTEKSNNYGELKRALKNLMKHTFELREQEKHIWHATKLLNDVQIAEGDGMISFVSPKWLLEYIVNFVNGNFTVYNLGNALKLRSAYAVRFYWLTCNMSSPVDYPLEMLRDMLGAKNKYPNNKDFLERCVDSAMGYLQKAGVNGFTYKKIKKGRRISALRLIPVKREELTQEQLTAQATIGAWVPPSLRQYLEREGGLMRDELNKNKATLFEFSKLPDWPTKVAGIIRRKRNGDKGPGYVFAAMKREVRAAIKARALPDDK